MKTRHLSIGLRRTLAILLMAVLLLSDHRVLYAAEAVVSPSASGSIELQTEPKEKAGTVSDGDVGDDTASGKGEKPAENTGNTTDSDDKPDSSEDTSETVSGGDAGTVSGGDALKPGRLPEAFYEEEIPESYGTLVSYDQYSRTYHVDGNRYVTVVGNDGATYIDDDGSLRPVDNTLEKDTTAVFGLFGGEETSYRNRANDYTVVLPENLDREEGKGITIANEEAVITLYPAEGDFTGGLAKDNAVRYSEVFPGVDYQYTVLGNSVKEDIILLERGERNSFSYLIDPCGLAGEIRGNTLYLYEPGTDPEAEAVFVVEAPEMTDSAEEISFGVSMSMEEQGDLLLVTVTADKEWLSAPERVYCWTAF